MKDYPLEVMEMHDIDSGGRCAFYSKGHHDADKFAAEVKREFEIEIDLDRIQARYMRWEMYTGPDGPCQIGADHLAPGRGIFPITIVNF